MKREAFLKALGRALKGMPRQERTESLSYYGEMIDERMETGMGEEEAVAALGPVEEIAAQVLQSAPQADKKPMRPLTLVLLILGSPLWLALVLALAAVALALVIVAFVLLIALYMVPVAISAASVVGVVLFGMEIIRANWMEALMSAGAACVCGGLSLLIWPPCVRGGVALWKWVKSICREIWERVHRGGYFK